MLTSVIALVATTALLVGGQAADKAAQISILKDVALPLLDPEGTESSGDVYFLPDGKQRPLLVVMPGRTADKAGYSGIATELASAGDGVVLVAQQINSLDAPDGMTITGNLVTKGVLNEAVEWAKALPANADTDSPAVDASEVYAIGHSLGATIVVEALTEGEDGVTMPPEVRSSFGYGFSLYDDRDSMYRSNTNNGGSFIWINGSKDTTSTPETDAGTAARLKAPSAHAVISDLDHFSIGDNPPPRLPPDEELSTLPRDEQVARVAECIRAWLNGSLIPGSEGSAEQALSDQYACGNVVSYQEKLE